MVSSLGGKVVHSPSECTHLVMDKFGRTVKLLAAINVCRFIVTSTWIQNSYKAGVWEGTGVFFFGYFLEEEHVDPK
jgi:hypothetical protein